METLEFQTMNMFGLKIFVLLFLTFSVADSLDMYLELGVKEYTISLSPMNSESADTFEYFMMQKSMYANSEIGVEVLNCSSDPKDCKFSFEWTVRQSDCDGIYREYFANTNTTTYIKKLGKMYNEPNCFYLSDEYLVSYVKSSDVKPNPDILCSEDSHETHDKLNDLKGENWECSTLDKSSRVCNKKAYCGPIKETSTDADTKPDDGSKIDEKNTESSKGDNPADTSTDTKRGIPSQRKKRADEDPQQDPANSDAGNKTQDEVGTETDGKDQENGEGTETDSKDQKGEVKAEPTAANNTLLKYRVVHTNVKDGRFIFIANVTSKSAKTMNITFRVRMKSPHGYLSATQYPLLPFYGTMCAVYSILGLIWIVLLFRQWKDILRIQFWISVVIILGLIEKAAFVAEFERHNNSGSNSSAGIFFAEELSVLKRTMARMLVIVVSLGYGITRPRLGRDLNWLMGAGVLFFLLSSIEAYFKIYKANRTDDLIALLPLSVLDAVLCWWIFRSLVDTSRTLRLRRNLVKLWLYRHFTNALIFCVVAAVIFLLWSIKAHRMNKCVKNWNEIWVDEAYWHILFCVILIVIMILLRPTANNQRYAYSVLSDAADDEDSKEPMMNDAFESVKMRNVHSGKTNNQPKEVDDLQWVEDNIPAAVADAALGAFDDSEEELITNIERNKME